MSYDFSRVCLRDGERKGGVMWDSLVGDLGSRNITVEVCMTN